MRADLARTKLAREITRSLMTSSDEGRRLRGRFGGTPTVEVLARELAARRVARTALTD
jgi:hypothetical protein